jgi:hypothetical protein
VRVAEHDEVVERFATYRSDEPFDVAVLPRRARCGRAISDPHGTNTAGRTECAVAVDPPSSLRGPWKFARTSPTFEL